MNAFSFEVDPKIVDGKPTAQLNRNIKFKKVGKKMLMKRKWNILLLLLVFVLVLSACGSNSGGNKPAVETKDQGNKDEPVKLKISWQGSQARNDQILKTLDLYTKSNPNITLEPDYAGLDTYYTKLATQAAGSSLPDILMINTNYFFEYASRGQLLDLAEGINMEDIDKNLLSAGKIDGKLYALPIGTSAISMIYNKVALDKLGVIVPDKGFSWDEWIKLARDLKPKLGENQYLIPDFSISTVIGESDKYEVYQLSHGKGFIHTPEGKFNIDKETYIEFNKLFASLRKEGLVPTSDVSVSHKQNDPKLDNLLNDTLLVNRAYSPYLPGVDGVKPGQYALTEVPHAEQSGGFVLPSQFFAISAHSKHIEESKLFIDWFVNNVEAGKILGFVNGPQVSKKVLGAIISNVEKTDKAQSDLIGLMAADAHPFSSRPKGYGNWSIEYAKVSQEIGFDKITPEEGYENLKEKWEEIINR